MLKGDRNKKKSVITGIDVAFNKKKKKERRET